MQHFCKHGYIFDGLFSRIFFKECFIFMIWIVRDYVKDHLSFYLKYLALKMKEL